MPGMSGDGERAADKCQGAGRVRQLPAKPKSAADALDLIPTLDSTAAVHQRTAAACRQHLSASYHVASDASTALAGKERRLLHSTHAEDTGGFGP